MGESLKHPGIEMQCVVSGKDTNGQVCSYIEKTDYMAGPPRHIHYGQYEIFYVLEGQYRFVGGKEEQVLGPGESLVIPPGQEHAFQAISKDGAKMRFDLLPALKSEEFFEGLSDVIAQEKDIAAYFGSYDSELTGPPLS